MLARSTDDVADIDGLLDLYAAMAKLAIKDYQTLPCGDRHYETARLFLETSGLLSRVDAPAHAAVPHQLTLFRD